MSNEEAGGSQGIRADDFTAGLSERLRREGVAFKPAELQAFAAKVRRELADDHDIEALAWRFREVQVATLKRKRARAWFEDMCIVGVGVVLLAFATLAAMVCINPPAGAEVDWASVTIVGGGGSLLGVALVAFGAIHLILRLNRLAPKAN